MSISFSLSLLCMCPSLYLHLFFNPQSFSFPPHQPIVSLLPQLQKPSNGLPQGSGARSIRAVKSLAQPIGQHHPEPLAQAPSCAQPLAVFSLVESRRHHAWALAIPLALKQEQESSIALARQQESKQELKQEPKQGHTQLLSKPLPITLLELLPGAKCLQDPDQEPRQFGPGAVRTAQARWLRDHGEALPAQCKPRREV